MHIFIIGLYLFLTSLSAAGCQKNRDSSGQTPERITVSAQSITLKPGESRQISAALVPAGSGTVAFQWQSADENIVTVQEGLITAVHAGQSTVTVRYAGYYQVIKVKVANPGEEQQLATLFEAVLNAQPLTALELNGAGRYTQDGLRIDQMGPLVKLDKFYALAQRKVRYLVRFAADSKAVFQSSEGDFKAYVDVGRKIISIATDPASEQAADFLQAGRDYIVEVIHDYQKSQLTVIDPQTGVKAEISAIQDGQGGVGKGVIHQGYSVGMQWDYYCFGLVEGAAMLVKKISVFALKKSVKLLLYGDSISQPEAYFPTKDFQLAWTQQIIRKLQGQAISSGRGGARIDMILDYIKNELPFIRAEYVMVTIGTNGGNTEEKLKALMRYIRAQGAIPLLNNIPCNESGTQLKTNELIEKVRRDLDIQGCQFDVATSLNGDGREVDQTLMYWEDYTGSYGWQIYHHPNAKGGTRMFEQTLRDLPGLYQQ
ncbi:hypothetical protein GCM10027051_33510 [Niabella terrae]